MHKSNKTNKNYFFTIVLLMAILFFAGCSSDDDAGNVTPEETENVMLSNNSTLGNILVDSEGMTLYFFTRDVSGESKCEAGNCLTNWPVFLVEDVDPGTGLDAADFATITRGDGERQTTYKGWPLYYFANDAQPGDTNGEGVSNVWFVAKPDYSIMLANEQLVGNDGKNYTDEYVEGEAITQYFVDAEGRTLYVFLPDSRNQNNYTNPDFSNDDVWPIFHTEISSLPDILDAADFGEIDVFGRTQLTYRGWPLYYFGQDEARGDNKGVSVPSPGVWPIVNTETPEAEEAVAEEENVNIEDNATLGNILVDAEGITLYYFSKDVNGDAMCADGCLANWPAFYAEEITPGAGLDAADFENIVREDGANQTTYKGWPLYYFAGDGEAGDTNGEGLSDIWFVAKPDYSIMLANAQLVGNDGKNYTSAYAEGDGMTPYFVDAEGRTLYAFTNDGNNNNNFTNEDLSNNAAWPIFYVDIASLPSTVDPADFEVIDVFGSQQLTYKGWPLYYFGQDAERGENKGVSVPSPGVWPIVNTSTTVAP